MDHICNIKSVIKKLKTNDYAEINKDKELKSHLTFCVYLQLVSEMGIHSVCGE